MTLSEPVRAFLEQPLFAVLGTVNPDGTAQLTVVWYELQGDEILFNTRRGRVKDRNMRRDPRISLCILDGLRFVTVEGNCEITDDQAIAQADMRALAVRYDGEESGNRQADEIYSKQTRVSVRLPIGKVILHGFDE